MANIKRLRLTKGLAVGAAVSTISLTTLAEEPRGIGEPNVLAEPTELLRIVDAFDDRDPFDLHLSLGFRHTSRSANIYREGTELASDSYTRTEVPVAQFSESISRLETRADMGLFRDLALIIRMPIVLSRSSDLTSLDGSDSSQSEALAGAVGADGTPEQLFALPFQSPSRSGIEYLALGLDVGIMNQNRDRSMPTWIIGAETRMSIAEPLHACNPNSTAGQVNCADPSDQNRDGSGDAPGNTRATSRSAGISRGTTGLEVHTYASKRLRFVEPYGGFRALFEFADANSDLNAIDVRGSVVGNAPIEGSVIMGIAAYPWEARDKFQRIALDFSYEGKYRSEGLDYSELFDALGSSDANNSLRTANHTEYVAGQDAQGNPSSVVDPDSPSVYFNGITDVQQHISHRLRAEVTWQAGEYVRFKAGAAYGYVQPHIITSSQSCNSDVGASPDTAGRCRSVSQNSDGSTTIRANGVPNPNYRAAIDAVGRRFKVDGTHEIDAWLSGTLMF